VLAGSARADELRDARKALEAGQLDEAQRLYERAASQGSAEGRAGVGQVLLRRRQYDAALEQFANAQKIDPTLAWTYAGPAEVFRRRSQCDQAVPLYRKAMELDRKFPEALLGLGDCLVQTGKVSEAVSALQEGLKWGSWRPRFLVALGLAELSRDSLRDAGIYLTRAREEAPEDPLPRKALGDFYLKRGISSLAVPEYRAAVALDSTDLDLHNSLGEALYYDQRYVDALNEFHYVVRRDSLYASAVLSLGNIYYLSGPNDPRRYLDAKFYLLRAVRLMPDNGKAWSLLGRTLYFLGERDAAYDALTKAEAMGATSREMYTVFGRLYTDRREWRPALAAFAKGDPTPNDQLRIGQIYVFLDSAAVAESVYRLVIQRDGASTEARFALSELGKLRFRQKRFEEALAFLRQRIALDPENEEAYYYIGLSYKELKKYPEALDSLRIAARMAPDKPDRHFWLGVLYAQFDSTQRAQEEFQRSVALDSTNRVTAAVSFQQLGYYRLLSRDWVGATRMLERSTALNDQNVQAWVWLGQGYQNAGDRARALDAYNRALQLDPNQPDALKGRKSLSSSG
jgi:tetratricopeptide (TPR) repeat protein